MCTHCLSGCVLYSLVIERKVTDLLILMVICLYYLFLLVFLCSLLQPMILWHGVSVTLLSCVRTAEQLVVLFNVQTVWDPRHTMLEITFTACWWLQVSQDS